MSQNRDNTGALFRNSRKKWKPNPEDPKGPKIPATPEDEKKPDYIGQATVDGVDYWMSAWVKVSEKQKGQKYFSFAFSKKPVEVEL